MKTEKRNTNEQEQSAICKVTNSSSQRRRYVAAPEPENIAELIYLAMIEWEIEEELAAEQEGPEI